MSKDNVNWKARYRVAARELAALKQERLTSGVSSHLIDLGREQVEAAASSLSQEAALAIRIAGEAQATVKAAFAKMRSETEALEQTARSLGNGQYQDSAAADAMREALASLTDLTLERDEAVDRAMTLTKDLQDETRARVTLSVELKDLYRKGVLGTDTAKILNRHFGPALRASSRHLQALWPSTETQEGLRHLFNWAKGALTRQAEYEKKGSSVRR